MSDHEKRPLAEAQAAADRLIEKLRPHCAKIDIAGSIRRQCPMVGDIEIICQPKPYTVGDGLGPDLFGTVTTNSGIATVIAPYPRSYDGESGKLAYEATRYVRRHIDGWWVDLFMPHPDGYGLQHLIRTGSVDWVRGQLIPALRRLGLRCAEGLLWQGEQIVPVYSERELAIAITLPPPEDREVTT